MITMSNKNLNRLFTILPLVIAVLVLIFSGLVYARADFTENRAFTLSEVTKESIRELEDPISITYFLSSRLEREIPEVQAVTDTLREVANLNPTMVSLRILDPESDSSVNPQELGISPQQYRIVQENRATVELVYAGIAINYRDEISTLPLVADSSSVEYELIKAVRELVTDNKRVLGVMFGRFGMDTDYNYLLNLLQDFAEIRLVAANEEIPAEVQVLLLIGHEDITEKGAFLLDQYLMAGRPLFVSLDHSLVDLRGGFQPIQHQRTPIFDVLEHYGFRLQPGWVMDPQNQPIPAIARIGSISYQTQEPYPMWPRVGSSGADPEHPLTARFVGLDLFWASPVVYEGSRPEAVAFPLRSTPDARLQEGELTTITNDAVPGTLAPEDGFPLMLTYEGELESAFDSVPEIIGDWTLLEQSTAPVRLALLGDQDVFADIIEVNSAAYNLEFLKNAYEWLAGDEALLGIRTRPLRNTALDKISDAEEFARRSSSAQVLGIALGPAAFGLIGLARFLMRRRKKRSGNTADLAEQGGEA